MDEFLNWLINSYNQAIDKVNDDDYYAPLDARIRAGVSATAFHKVIQKAETTLKVKVDRKLLHKRKGH
jgi:hypothetical protein